MFHIHRSAEKYPVVWSTCRKPSPGSTALMLSGSSRLPMLRSRPEDTAGGKTTYAVDEHFITDSRYIFIRLSGTDLILLSRPSWRSPTSQKMVWLRFKVVSSIFSVIEATPL